MAPRARDVVDAFSVREGVCACSSLQRQGIRASGLPWFDALSIAAIKSLPKHRSVLDVWTREAVGWKTGQLRVVSPGWDLEVERGPDWLFVRLGSYPVADSDMPSLAGEIWSILDRCFVYRLVLQLDGCVPWTAICCGNWCCSTGAFANTVASCGCAACPRSIARRWRTAG